MRTVTFKSVLNDVLTLLGLDASATEDAATKAAAGVYIATRHREAWEQYDWPETRVLEARTYYPQWTSGAGLVTGDIVYHLDAYWRATMNAPAAEPAEGATGWETATDFEKVISLAQAGETEMSEVIALYSADPRTRTRGVREVPFELTEDGALVAADAVNQVWVEFSKRCPEFTTREWEAGTAYAAGDVVYHEADCYVAAGASTGSVPAAGNGNWLLQPVLHVLSRFTTRAAYADLLAEDGQVTKSDWHLGQAYRALEDELAKLALKQGQVREITVKTR